MQTTSYSLGELLRRAKDGSLTIPQFQRQFVWRESQVKLLIDSMSRSYPIGSLLLLARKAELPLTTRSIEAEIREGYPSNGIPDEDKTGTDEESYILDGQQRTTSIARVFLNAHPKKLYYFDLKRMLETHEREETSWILTLQRGKTEPDRKKNNRLLRADIILDQAKADIYVSEYIEDSGDFPEFEHDKTAGRKAAARIKGVFETMRNYKVPVVMLERDSGVESVCRVFETINSTGTRLTTFDLAVARFYPKPDLRGLWADALDEHPTLKNFDVDGERVLQVLYLVASARKGKYPDPTRSNLLALTPDEIGREWGRSSKALAETYKWVRAYGARPETLPSHYVLVALAAVRGLVQDDVSKNPWTNGDLIRRWYFSKIMHAGASQASNYRIGQDFDALRRYASDGTPPAVTEVSLNVDMVLQLKPTDVRYKSLQNVFAMTLRQDLMSGHKIDSESVLHDHHIYPKSARRKHSLPPRMLDGICNRVPVLDVSNLSLGEAYPDVYFQAMADRAQSQGTLGDLSRRLQDCMIPGNPQEPTWANSFSIQRFEAFCRNPGKFNV
jgi:hypothetical protein